jgi:hypothetical protein
MITPKKNIICRKNIGSPKSATKTLDEQTLETVKRIGQLAMRFPQYNYQTTLQWAHLQPNKTAQPP